MRTKHFLAVLAGVALASCVTDKEYVPKLEEQTRIAFGSPVMYDNGKETRANVYGEIGSVTDASGVTHTYPNTEQFRIFAVKYDEAAEAFPGWEGTTQTPVVETLFNGAVAVYDGRLDGWVPKKTGSPADKYYYWPANMKIAYAAYSPADLEQSGNDWNDEDINPNVTYGKTGLTIKDFKVSDDPAEQFDLMFSKRQVDMTKDKMLNVGNLYSGAPIVFQHALSSIHFSIANTSSAIVVPGENGQDQTILQPKVEIELLKITVKNVKNVGTFTEGINEGSNPAEYIIKNGDNGGNVSPSWNTNSSGTHNYVAFKAAGYVEDGDNSTVQGLPFPETPQYIAYYMANNTEYTNIGENHPLLLIPQDLEGAQLEIKYKVINGEDNTVVSTKTVSLDNAPKVDTQTGKLTNQVVSKWEIGTKYTYRLVYSSEAAKQDKIYFSPSSENWNDAGVVYIDLAKSDN